MKVEGGKTIMHGKKGNIVYQSKAKAKLLSNFIDNTRYSIPDELVDTIKFEDRKRNQKEVPIQNFSEIYQLLDFNAFSFDSGRPRYRFYDFTKSIRGTKKQKLMAKKIKKSCWSIGLDNTWSKMSKMKEHNTFKSTLEKFEIEVDLNKYFKKSMKQFLGVK